MKPGDSVEVLRAIDIIPHMTVQSGEHGTIMRDMGEGFFGVRFDQHRVEIAVPEAALNLVNDYTCSTAGPECPYCGRAFVADEPFYYDESKFTEMECDACGKEFKVEVCHSVSWECRKLEE